MDVLVNKVQQSGLIQMDLEHYKPNRQIFEIDIADQLYQGLIIKEKDFRAWIKECDWSVYSNSGVALYCSVDAIVPTWAYMLVAAELSKVESICVFGNRNDLVKRLVINRIERIDLKQYENGKIIIKGCADHPFPEFAMTELVRKLQPHVQSIMYGEPCSTVPIYKKKAPRNQAV